MSTKKTTAPVVASKTTAPVPAGKQQPKVA